MPDHFALIEAFYATSDNPTAHDHYVNFFSPNATMIMGLRRSSGYDQIMATRQGMWVAVESRHHVVTKVYPSTSLDEDELMLFGTVDYVLKNGRGLSSDWAGRMVFDGNKIGFYQVWLDASPLLVAQGKKIQSDGQGSISIV